MRWACGLSSPSGHGFPGSYNCRWERRRVRVVLEESGLMKRRYCARKRGRLSKPALEPLEAKLLLTTFVDAGFGFGQDGAGFHSIGSAWGDIDNDGWPDFYDGSSKVFRNNQGTGFTVVTDLIDGNAVFGDFDNDGFDDLFAFTTGSEILPRLYRNINGTSFQDVSSMLPNNSAVVSRGATWGDFNSDGWLDIYMGGASYADRIYINNGGTGFTLAPGAGSTLYARGVTAADFDEDDDLDVYVSDYFLQPNLLWVNDGSGTFTNEAAARGVQGAAHTIGSAWGDLDEDGHIDLFIGNFSHVGNPPARFMRNTGPSGGWTFQEMDALDGNDWVESYASPALGDADNDGDLDLFYSAVSSGTRFYRNHGNFNFVNETSTSGLSGLIASYQGAWADFDRDGDLDLSAGTRLYINQNNSGHSWLSLRLRGDGANVSTTAIGAQVRADVGGGRIITRQVEGGTGEGNQNDLALHFGLGSHAGDLPIEIRWPDGRRVNLVVSPNQHMTITYGDELPSSSLPVIETFDGGTAGSFIPAEGTWQVDGQYVATPDAGAKAISLQPSGLTLPDAFSVQSQVQIVEPGSVPPPGSLVETFDDLTTADLDAAPFERIDSGAATIANGLDGHGSKVVNLRQHEGVQMSMDGQHQFATGVVEFDLYMEQITAPLQNSAVDVLIQDNDGFWNLVWDRLGPGWGGDVDGIDITWRGANGTQATAFNDVMAYGEWTHFRYTFTANGTENGTRSLVVDSPTYGVQQAWRNVPFKDGDQGHEFNALGRLVFRTVWLHNENQPPVSQVDNIVVSPNVATPAFRNALLIYDYQGPNDFKYAGAYAGTQQWRLGRFNGTSWLVDASASSAVATGVDYQANLVIDGGRATLLVDGVELMSHDFGGTLSEGRIGLGTNNAVARFDNFVTTEFAAFPYFENFDDGGAAGMSPVQGDWEVTNDRFRAVAPAGGDAVSLIQLSNAVPGAVTMSATLQGAEGPFKNSILVYDYLGPDDFKFAGAFYGADAWRIGRYQSGSWVVDASASDSLSLNTDYDVELQISDDAVTLLVDGQQVLAHTFADALTDGRFGLATNNAVSNFDDVALFSRVSLPYAESFEDGTADGLLAVAGAWRVESGRYEATPPLGADAISILQMTDSLPARLEFGAKVTGIAPTGGYYANAVLVFDYEDESNFGFAGGFFGADEWRIGRVVAGTWNAEVIATASLANGVDYEVDLRIDGSAVTLTVDGSTVAHHDFGVPLDGGIGVGTNNAQARLDDLSAAEVPPGDTTAPQIVEVLVRGPDWTNEFFDHLTSIGDGLGGYRVSSGAGQVDPLPWPVDEIEIRFDEAVVASSGDLRVYGVHRAEHGIAGFTYDAATHAGTWTLGAPIASDRLMLHLADTVTDSAGNRLDGEWIDGISTRSGDGAATGDFTFRLDVHESDANRDGVAGADDLGMLLSAFTAPAGAAGYSKNADFNGDGIVASDDLQSILASFAASLPVTEPSAPARGALLAAAGAGTGAATQASSQDDAPGWLPDGGFDLLHYLTQQ